MKKNKKNYILGLLAIIAILVIISNLGSTILSPFNFRIDFNYKNSEYLDDPQGYLNEFDEETFIIDNNKTRISILNKNKQLMFQRDMNFFDGDIMYFLSVASCNNEYYILCCTKYENSDNIKEEKILCVNTYLNHQETVFSITHSNDDNITIPPIIDIQSYKNDIYLSCVSDKDELISIKKLTENKQLETYKEFKYDSSYWDIYAIKYDFNKNILGALTTSMTIVQYIDGNINYINPPQNLESPYVSISINENGSIQPHTIKEIQESSPSFAYWSPQLIIYTLIIWLSIAYLLILSIVLIIHLIKKVKDKSSLSKLIYGVLISILIVGISYYYSQNSYNSKLLERSQLTSAILDHFVNTPGNYLANSINSFNNLDDLRNPEITNLKKYTEDLDLSYRKQGINIDFSVLKVTKDDVYSYLLYETNNDYLSYAINNQNKETVVKSNLETLQNHGTLKYGFDESGYLDICSYKAIFDTNNNIIGIAGCSSNFTTLNHFIINNSWILFTVLLVAIITMVLFFSEIKSIIESLKNFKIAIKKKQNNKELCLYRPIRFFINYLIIFNSVLLVLITKDLLETTGFKDISVLLSIPPLLSSAGLFFGQIIYDNFSRKMTIKKLISILVILQIITFIGCFASIKMLSYEQFCLWTFLSSICTGALAGITMYMPIISKNEKERFELYNHKSLAGISSSAISIAVSGAIANSIGNEFIYIGVLIPTIGVGLLLLISLPKKTIYSQKSKNSNDKSSTREIFKVILNPAFISLMIFVFLAGSVASGYKSFLFPLFTDNKGFSKVEISNFVVIANFISYLLNKPLVQLTHKFDYWKVTTFSILSFGIVFLCFYLNSSILWAFITIALIAIISKFNEPNRAMLWPRLCKEKNISQNPINSFLIYYSNFTDSMKSVILSLFIVLGPVMSCVCLGICLVGCSLIFAITTYKSSLNKS